MVTEAIKRGAEAMVQYETSGICLPGKKCQMCDCGVQNMDREQLAEDLLRNQERVRHTLTAALSDRDGLARVLYEEEHCPISDDVWENLTTGGHYAERSPVGRAFQRADAAIAHLIGEDR